MRNKMEPVRAAKQSLRQQEQQKHQYETLGNRSAVLKWWHVVLANPINSLSGILLVHLQNVISVYSVNAYLVDGRGCRGPLVLYIFIEIVLRH